MLGIECVATGRPHKQYAGCTTCNLMNMEAELERVKDELTDINAWKETHAKLEAEYDALRSHAEKLNEGLMVFYEHYLQGRTENVDLERACQALSDYRAFTSVSDMNVENTKRGREMIHLHKLWLCFFCGLCSCQCECL